MPQPLQSELPADGAELSERQRRILQIVREQGFATIEALARAFDVSAQSIRRDIIRLDEARLLQRFHGGAGVIDSRIRLGYAEKSQASRDAKQRIGAALADSLPDGASLFLDVGTTVEAVARNLGRRQGLHLFTNSIAAAGHLAGLEGHEIFVTGGSLRGPDGSLVGDTTVSQLAAFKVDVAVIGLSGFDDDGAPMDFDLHKVAVKQAMIANARRVVAVCDASKFQRHAVIRIAPLERFDELVCDAAPPPGLQARLEAARTAVRIV